MADYRKGDPQGRSCYYCKWYVMAENFDGFHYCHHDPLPEGLDHKLNAWLWNVCDFWEWLSGKEGGGRQNAFPFVGVGEEPDG